MADEVVLCLDHQVVLVEDVDGQNRIALELFRGEQAAQGQFVSGEVVNPDLAKRIPHYEVTALRNR